MSGQPTASERMFESAVVAYGFACSEEAEPRGLRAAVRRVLDLQREEIAQAIEAAGTLDGERWQDKAARIARDYGKES